MNLSGRYSKKFVHGADFANLGDAPVETVSTVGRRRRVGECIDSIVYVVACGLKPVQVGGRAVQIRRELSGSTYLTGEGCTVGGTGSG